MGATPLPISQLLGSNCEAPIGVESFFINGSFLAASRPVLTWCLSTRQTGKVSSAPFSSCEFHGEAESPMHASALSWVCVPCLDRWQSPVGGGSFRSPLGTPRRKQTLERILGEKIEPTKTRQERHWQVAFEPTKKRIIRSRRSKTR